VGLSTVAATTTAAHAQHELLSPGALHMRQLSRLALGSGGGGAAPDDGQRVLLPELDGVGDPLLHDRLDRLAPCDDALA
jgi:hypothetical protein